MMDEIDRVEAKMKPKEPIPDFKSREEEAEFWDTHDFADYIDEWEPVQVTFADNLSADTTIVAVQLDPVTMQQVQQEARDTGLGPSALIGTWVVERLSSKARPA